MLESIELISAPFGPTELRPSAPRLRVPLSAHSAFPTPLIAYDLPWHLLPAAISRQLADELDAIGISVGGLRSEFRRTDTQEDSVHTTLPLSICPYRPDRFGLLIDDLQRAKMIDIRLHPTRDADGLPHYRSSLLRSWDLRSAQLADRAEEIYGGMQAIHWPPDVDSISSLSCKVTQLRLIAPQASICISLDAYHAPQVIQQIVAADPDTVGIYAASWPVEHIDSLIDLIVGISDFLRSGTRRRFLLVVPPPQINTIDCMKLLALGSDIIAIDGWCESTFAEPSKNVSSSQWAANTLGITGVSLGPEPQARIDFSHIEQNIEFLRRLAHSMGLAEITQIDRSYLRSYSDKIRRLHTAYSNPQDF